VKENDDEVSRQTMMVKWGRNCDNEVGNKVNDELKRKKKNKEKLEKRYW
jgi:hypothetical protein